MRRRKAVDHLQETFSISERRACETAGQHRTTQRYQPKQRSDEEALVKAMLKKVGQRPRYVCRRITQLLREEGWDVSYKRIHRLWKREGLRVPPKRKKKRFVGSGANACDKGSTKRINDVWTLDFIHDRLVNGRQIRCLAILDEFTRENLTLKFASSLNAQDVLDELNQLIQERGVPANIRSDNGSEFISIKVKEWLEKLEIGALFIEPGAPWQNGYIEGFNSRLRDEFLNMEHFCFLKEAQHLAKRWKDDYNYHRPHSALGYQTPKQFAKSLGSTS